MHEFRGGKVGHEPNKHALDRTCGIVLTRNNVFHTKYVDNLLCFGHDPATVQLSAQALETELNTSRLTVHELFGPVRSAVFVGLDFDGLKHTVTIGVQRVWKLRLALDHVLESGRVRGKCLEAIVGHSTWSCSVKREGLCLLDCTYIVIHTYIHRPDLIPLWHTVYRKPRFVRSLLPVTLSHTHLPWWDRVSASDSSGIGFCACERFLAPDMCWDIGAVSEKWRDDFEDAVDARKHALGTAQADNTMDGPDGC